MAVGKEVDDGAHYARMHKGPFFYFMHALFLPSTAFAAIRKIQTKSSTALSLISLL